MFSGQKPPTFGATSQNQPAFSGFGQSAFSRSTTTPNNTGFGATSFGTNSSVFGAQPNANTSLFGSAANTAQQPASTAFGSSFGQPAMNQSSSLFGATNQNPTGTTSLFGSTQTSTFGAPQKPAGFGFMQPSQQPATSLFGQTQQPQQQSLFGQTAGTTSSTLFGAGSAGGSVGGGAFGQPTQNGTAVAKFQPPNETDALVKGSSTQYVQTKQQCITFMKEYAEKSLEELRYEDYLSNRKGPQNGLFGNNQSSGIFGQTQPATSSLFGQPSIQPSSGIFGATQGATNSTLNTFGAPTNTGIFGKPLATPAVSSAAPSFGGFGSSNTSNFGISKPFGQQAAPATGIFGSQPSTGFGQPATNTFSSAPSFGQQQQAAPSFFGSSTPAAAPIGGNTFGTLGNTAATAAPSSGFVFGGANTNQASNLFGAPKPTFASQPNAFGTTQTQSNVFSGFGSAQPAAQPGNLFGGIKPSFGTLGQPASSTASVFMPNTGISSFGTSAPTGGLFGSSNPPSSNMFGATTNPFGSSANTGLGFGSQLPQMGNSLSAPQQMGTEIHQRVKNLTYSPYGDDDLFRNIRSVDFSGDALKATNPIAQKAFLETGFKISPNTMPKIKVKPVNAVTLRKNLFDGLEEHDASLEESFTIKPNPKRLIIKPRASIATDNSMSRKEDESFLNKSQMNVSMKGDVSAATGKENISNEVFGGSIPQTKYVPEDDLGDRRVSWLKTRPKVRGVFLDNTDANLSMRASLNSSEIDASGASDTSAFLQTSADNQNENVSPAHSESIAPNAAGITLRRAGYYTIPSLDDLKEYVDNTGHCFVPNFTIGRRGYGNVYFDEQIDVANLNLDDICHFRNKEIILYQDDDNKPPVGSGLNRKAQVTLDNIWPYDKTTHQPIKELAKLEAMGYEEKLRRICEKRSAKFLEYRAETGSCVFKVDHFSKYTLDDSDDEGDEVVDKTKVVKQALKRPLQVTDQTKTGTDGILPTEILDISKRFENSAVNLNNSNVNAQSDEMSSMTSPSSFLAKEMRMDTHKLQLMKASFFVHDKNMMNISDESDCESIGWEQNPDQIVPVQNGEPIAQKDVEEMLPETYYGRENFVKSAVQKEPLLQTFKIVTPQSRPLIEFPRIMSCNMSMGIDIPPSESILTSMKNPSHSFVPFIIGRKFKVSWTTGNKFTMLTPRAAGHGKDGSSLSKNVIQIQEMSNVTTNETKSFDKSIIEHLSIELKHDKSIKTTDMECQRLEANSKTGGLYEHFQMAKNIAKEKSNQKNNFNATVWSLMNALWYEMGNDYNQQDHSTDMFRRDFVSNWLESVINSENSKQILEYLDNLTNLILCHKISDACELAMENGDMNLSLLIAQISSNHTLREFVKEQFFCWNEIEASEFIDERRLKIMMIISGISTLSTSRNTIVNIFEDQNWLRCFAIHLWFTSSPIASVTDAVMAYESSFQDEELNVALPVFSTKRGNSKYIDIRYHLMKLYSQKSYSLESLLHPAGYSNDETDYALSFLVSQVLETLDYHHLSDACKYKIYESFAEQLETAGLWEWSVWIMLHIQDQSCREKAIHQFLCRHIRIDHEINQEYSEKEKFIAEELNIPMKWIFLAKAIRAGALNFYQLEIKYLLKAQMWSKAHDVMMKYVAPDLFINDQIESLDSILSQFTSTNEIQSWKTQGGVFVNYIKLERKLSILLNESDECNNLISKLNPQLSELCSTIESFPCPTPKHRLCQSEITKKISYIIKNFYSKSGEAKSGIMRTVLDRLPLPHEYAHQEMKHILATFLIEKMQT